MSFALSKIAWALLTPSNVLVLGTGALILLAALTRRAAMLRLAALAAVVLLAGAVLPLGLWLARPLEDRFPLPAALPDDLAGVIILGGAQEGGIERARGRLAVSDHAERLIEGVDLALRHPGARLVFSGGSAALVPGEANEEHVNRRYVAMARVAPDRVVYESRSRNTWENALNTKALVDPAPDEAWALVTSAMHMPRAVGIFRRLGWEVIPYPVDYTTGDKVGWTRLPAAGGRLRELDAAAREWTGLLAYRLAGRTNALFPAPEPAASPAAVAWGTQPQAKRRRGD